MEFCAKQLKMTMTQIGMIKFEINLFYRRKKNDFALWQRTMKGDLITR